MRAAGRRVSSGGASTTHPPRRTSSRHVVAHCSPPRSSGAHEPRSFGRFQRPDQGRCRALKRPGPLRFMITRRAPHRTPQPRQAAAPWRLPSSLRCAAATSSATRCALRAPGNGADVLSLGRQPAERHLRHCAALPSLQLRCEHRWGPSLSRTACRFSSHPMFRRVYAGRYQSAYKPDSLSVNASSSW